MSTYHYFVEQKKESRSIRYDYSCTKRGIHASGIRGTDQEDGAGALGGLFLNQPNDVLRSLAEVLVDTM